MVITISCPSCLTPFPVDTAKVPEGGVNARCSNCSDIFRVEHPSGLGAGFEDAPATGTEDWAAGMESSLADAMASQESVGTDAGFGGGTEDTFFGAGVGEEEPLPTFDDPLPTFEEAAAEEEPLPAFEEAAAEEEPLPTFEEAAAEEEPLPTFEAAAPEVASETAATEVLPPVEAADAGAPQAFSFGQRDPLEKAKRLARVLVSDMIMYNPEPHEQALANGTLKEDFEEEIEKSWKEYVEQVGEDVAESNQFWTDALNEVLAKGAPIF